MTIPMNPQSGAKNEQSIIALRNVGRLVSETADWLEAYKEELPADFAQRMRITLAQAGVLLEELWTHLPPKVPS